eukprot:Gb_32495 [translate_table: standard]
MQPVHNMEYFHLLQISVIIFMRWAELDQTKIGSRDGGIDLNLPVLGRSVATDFPQAASLSAKLPDDDVVLSEILLEKSVDSSVAFALLISPSFFELDLGVIFSSSCFFAVGVSNMAIEFEVRQTSVVVSETTDVTKRKDLNSKAGSLQHFRRFYHFTKGNQLNFSHGLHPS